MEDYPTEYIESLHGDPIWEAIWQTIRSWDLSRDGGFEGGEGYAEATGDDATRIYDAIAPETARLKDELAEGRRAVERAERARDGMQAGAREQAATLRKAVRELARALGVAQNDLCVELCQPPEDGGHRASCLLATITQTAHAPLIAECKAEKEG